MKRKYTDDHQLQQYHQNKQSPLILNELIWVQAYENMVGLNQLMGSQPCPFDNWISTLPF